MRNHRSVLLLGPYRRGKFLVQCLPMHPEVHLAMTIGTDCGNRIDAVRSTIGQPSEMVHFQERMPVAG